MKQGSLRNERKFDKFAKDANTEMIQPNELAGVDMQSYTDLVRCGLDPWQYTYKVTSGVLNAYTPGTLEPAYVYDPKARVWAHPCVNDAQQIVQ